VGTGPSSWIFSSAVTCTALVLWLFKTILNNVRRPLSVNINFYPPFLFVDVVIPWFVHTNIILETVILNSPNNVKVFVTDAPAIHILMICPLSKSEKSPSFRFFHIDRLLFQTPSLFLHLLFYLSITIILFFK
jgi:hypothetical protein